MHGGPAAGSQFAEEHLSRPGWQRERQQNFYRMVQTNEGAAVDLVSDGWTDIIRNQQQLLAARRARTSDAAPSRLLVSASHRPCERWLALTSNY
jgi:hypothetical protein